MTIPEQESGKHVQVYKKMKSTDKEQNDQILDQLWVEQSSKQVTLGITFF